MGALAADRKALAVTQAAVAGQVHQTLDVDRGLATQVAFDQIVAVDRLADLQDFRVGQLIDAASVLNANLLDDLLGFRLADPMDVLQRDDDALVSRNVDASDTGHALNLLVTQRSANGAPAQNPKWEGRHVLRALSRKRTVIGNVAFPSMEQSQESDAFQTRGDRWAGLSAESALQGLVDSSGDVLDRAHAIQLDQFPLVFVVGQLLESIRFPLNYQISFIVLSIGALISYYFSSQITLDDIQSHSAGARLKFKDQINEYVRLVKKEKPFQSFIIKRFVVLTGSSLVLPVFPLYFVRTMQASDGWIATINMVQTAIVIIGYFFWTYRSRKNGTRSVLLWTTFGTALYPILAAFMPNVVAITVLAGINGIFHQFFYHGNRSFHHFACRNFVRYLFTK